MTFSSLDIIAAGSGTKLTCIFLELPLPRKMKKGAWDSRAYASNLIVFSGPLQYCGAFLSKPRVFWIEIACATHITMGTVSSGELLG